MSLSFFSSLSPSFDSFRLKRHLKCTHQFSKCQPNAIVSRARRLMAFYLSRSICMYVISIFDFCPNSIWRCSFRKQQIKRNQRRNCKHLMSNQRINCELLLFSVFELQRASARARSALANRFVHRLMYARTMLHCMLWRQFYSTLFSLQFLLLQ